ncbi:hypothetical protein Tco_1404053 [Tanacetum coccineum]
MNSINDDQVRRSTRLSNQMWKDDVGSDEVTDQTGAQANVDVAGMNIVCAYLVHQMTDDEKVEMPLVKNWTTDMLSTLEEERFRHTHMERDGNREWDFNSMDEAFPFTQGRSVDVSMTNNSMEEVERLLNFLPHYDLQEQTHLEGFKTPEPVKVSILPEAGKRRMRRKIRPTEILCSIYLMIAVSLVGGVLGHEERASETKGQDLDLNPKMVAEAFSSIEDPIVIVYSRDVRPDIHAPCAIFVDELLALVEATDQPIPTFCS